MGQGYHGLELAALPEYTPPLPRAGPGANVSHEVAMILIDGKQTARDIRAELKAQVEAAVSAGRRAPGLAVILVGEDPASQVYVRNKERACAEAGILSFPYRLPADTTQEALLALIAELNGRDDVDGILLQLPLPKHLSASACLLAIDPAKDVDGFHPENVGRLSLNLPGMVSCTPAGVIELLRRYNLPTRGKKAVVLGRSDIVGKPLALLLARPGEFGDATVTLCPSRTPDLAAECRSADFLFLAIGRPRMITGDMVREGAVIIDVGINRTDDGLCGDADFESVSKKAAAITPVPGGVGPMTIAMLLDYIGIMSDANAAQNDDLTLNLTVTDVNEQFYVTRKNGILLSYPGENHPDAQASVTCKRLQLFALMTGQQAGQVQISGDPTVLKRLLAYASKFEKTFNVIEP